MGVVAHYVQTDRSATFLIVFSRVLAQHATMSVTVYEFLLYCFNKIYISTIFNLYYKRAKELKIASHPDVSYPPKLVSLRSQIQCI
jgi:hypothetical protein